jgi:PPOX class probable F420-dependent enzyme
MALERSQITMTDAELQEFLDQERVVTCATIGPGGRPHLMPLWYVVEKGLIAAWTFAKSQKVRNLERVPKATLQVEAGRDRYAELRGAMLECDVEIVRDPATVEAIGLALAQRYPGLPPGSEISPERRAQVLKQVSKRVVLRFVPTRVVSWDHRKLSGPRL